MKKVVFIVAMLLFSFNSFASTDVIENPLIEYQSISDEDVSPPVYYYFAFTSCGVLAESFSYEEVAEEDAVAWAEAMEAFYCEEL